ncbi:hypothetical protein PAMA_001925 [Pampus argenteus]
MERGIMAREEEEERRGQPEEEVGGDDGVEGAEEENGGQDGDVEEELDRRYGSDSGDGGGKDDDVEMTEEGRKVEDDVVRKETDDNRWREEQQAVEGGELQRQVGGGEREGKETKEPGLAAKRKADRYNMVVVAGIDLYSRKVCLFLPVHNHENIAGIINLLGIQIEDIDWESSGNSCDNSANQGVTVPEIECPLKTEDIETLRLAIDPLSHSDSFGRDIYLTTLAHALYILQNH